MRSALALAGLLVACGGSTTPTDKAGMTDKAAERATEPPLVVAAATATTLPPDDPTLGGQYLVILASKTDAAEVQPALDAVHALGAPGARARTLLSSRFKNLMPCYTVAIADASADKKQAFALSKQLSAAKVDNYVKNAGDYVGPSAAVDAFCAGFVAGVATSSNAAIVASAGGRGWIAMGGAVPSPLGDPVRLDDSYGAWSQSVPRDSYDESGPSTWLVVDPKSGVSQSCKRKSVAALTLGTPHFGMLQGDEKPTAPVCGEPALYAELDCSVAEGLHVAVPEGGRSPVVYKRTEGSIKELEAAAKADLERVPGWHDFKPVDPSDEVKRSVSVSRFDGPSGAIFVVEGSIEDGDGVCGGDEVAWRAVYAAQGEGLGRRLGPYIEEHFSRLEGLIDVEADGSPEQLTTSFPDETTLWRIDGEELSHSSIAYCDCAC